MRSLRDQWGEIIFDYLGAGSIVVLHSQLCCHIAGQSIGYNLTPRANESSVTNLTDVDATSLKLQL